VLNGSGLLSPVIQQVAVALLADTVPSEWSQRWEGPDKPQTWLRELVRRRLALGKWRTLSAQDNLLNEPLELGELFNPSTFLNALRQQSARKLAIALDKVKMVSSWDLNDSRLAKICPLPCTLTNLLLQGASLSKGGRVALEESAPEANELTVCRPVRIGFASVDEPDLYDDEDAVLVPVYTTPSREQLLTEVQIPIGEESSGKWMLSGVALFLSEGE